MKFSCLIYRSAILLFLILKGCTPSISGYPDGSFHIMVISDVHISRDPEKDKRLQKLIADINAGKYPGTRALVVTGDCVSKIYSDKLNGRHPESGNNLTKLVALLDPLEVPFFLCMGNHDYKIDGDKDSDAPFTRQEIDTIEVLWKKITGFAPYYSTVYHGWRFIMLNSMRGRHLERAFDPEQLAWLERELAAEQPVLLFFHHPVETDHFHFWGKMGDLITEENEGRFFGLLAGNTQKIKGIFVGHGHSWIEDTLFDRIPVFETDSFGDSDALPFYLIGIDTLAQLINVSRSPVLIAGESR